MKVTEKRVVEQNFYETNSSKTGWYFLDGLKMKCDWEIK